MHQCEVLIGLVLHLYAVEVPFCGFCVCEAVGDVMWGKDTHGTKARVRHARDAGGSKPAGLYCRSEWTPAVACVRDPCALDCIKF